MAVQEETGWLESMYVLKNEHLSSWSNFFSVGSSFHSGYTLAIHSILQPLTTKLVKEQHHCMNMISATNQ